MDLWHLKIDSFYIFLQLSQLILKTSYKNIIKTSINFTNVFDFKDKFLNYNAFDEIKGLLVFTKYTVGVLNYYVGT